MSASPLAYLDAQRQVQIVDPSGGQRSLTRDAGVLWATWGQSEVQDVHSWPAWSPDGRRIAAFRIGRDGSEPRTVVLDLDGVASQEGPSLEGRVPVYLQWSPEGDRLAVLSQSEGDLVLDRLDPGRPEVQTELLRGTPLFFTWLDRGRIAAFVGEPSGPLMLVVSPSGARVAMPGQPGNFCSPVLVGEELVYVAHHRGRVAILVARTQGTGSREIEIVDGLVALVPAPDGRTVVRGVAPDGDGSPYRDLRQLDPVSGQTRRISDIDCLAFFVASEHLIVARRHQRRGTIVWTRLSLDGRDEEPLAEIHPSRDLRFWLRFFEQFCSSHPLVDPTGQTLVLTGDLVPNGASAGSDRSSAPRVWRVPIAGGRPEELGAGPFATFPPRALES